MFKEDTIPRVVALRACEKLLNIDEVYWEEIDVLYSTIKDLARCLSH